MEKIQLWNFDLIMPFTYSIDKIYIQQSNIQVHAPLVELGQDAALRRLQPGFKTTLFAEAKSAKTKSCAKNRFDDFFALMEKVDVNLRAFILVFFKGRK